MTASPPIVTPANSQQERQQLQQSQQQKRGCSGGSGGGDGSGLDEYWLTKLESLDRLSPADWEQLEQERNNLPWYHPSSHPPKKNVLVRVRGMVQDMLDVEYVQQKDDAAAAEDRDMMAGGGGGPSASWTERTPLIITAVPGTSPWLHRSLVVASQQGRDNCDEKKKGEQDADAGEEKKDDGEHGGDDDDDDHRQQQPSKKKLRLDNRGASGEERPGLWSSSGSASASASSSFGGDGGDNPAADAEAALQSQYAPLVLAKLYYEQYGAKSRLRLNDVVEMVGVLLPEDDQCGHGPGNDDADVRMAFSEEDPSHNWWDTADGGGCAGSSGSGSSLPANLARLHVLWYKPVDLDTLVATEYAHHAYPSLQALSPPPNTVLARALEVPEAAGVALWMALLSMAERQALPEDPDHDEGAAMAAMRALAIQTPQETTLGCASLNMVLPTADACRAFQTKLMGVLSQVVPQLVALDLSSLSMLDTDLGSPITPTQVRGRLAPTLLQLPKGSTLILNAGDQQPGNLSPSQEQALQEVQQLTGSHKIAYAFDGGVRIVFEADVRVVVLSTPRSRKLLPCTLQVKCRPSSLSSAAQHNNQNDGGPSSSSAAATAQLVAVRNALAVARGGGSRRNDQEGANNSHSRMKARPHSYYSPSSCNNIGLSRAVLEQAQKDFISRRSEAREKQQAFLGHQVDETDFHRWLTLTRLHARARMVETADLEDWELALATDDALVASFAS